MAYEAEEWEPEAGSKVESRDEDEGKEEGNPPLGEEKENTPSTDVKLQLKSGILMYAYQ